MTADDPDDQPGPAYPPGDAHATPEQGASRPATGHGDAQHCGWDPAGHVGQFASSGLDHNSPATWAQGNDGIPPSRVGAPVHRDAPPRAENCPPVRRSPRLALVTALVAAALAGGGVGAGITAALLRDHGSSAPGDLPGQPGGGPGQNGPDRPGGQTTQPSATASD
ncbi:hypothetical protein ACTOB_000413 [Actinoplanes oblitus]|uniref:Uncharacterized protein n=1 Tax=Actinoplanes oblitus TaxID=3040509 RepID=A0ABY8WGE7_9ACTN|nr:hypothetical protein [Actinoplanes oblitus]WIM96934.1 hypothetical protein ACTOB_000413 [Actinoplanes oblitus]